MSNALELDWESLFSHGSSPRAWGLRIIFRYFAPPRSVHPHVRGDYGNRRQGAGGSSGSSPRAWGLRILQRI